MLLGLDGSRNYPISADFFYVFCLMLFLMLAVLSAFILLASLREGREDQDWISAAYFVAASLLAALFWWLL